MTFHNTIIVVQFADEIAILSRNTSGFEVTKPAPIKQDVKYLGLILDTRLAWAAHIKWSPNQTSAQTQTFEGFTTFTHSTTHQKIVIDSIIKPFWINGCSI